MNRVQRVFQGFCHGMDSLPGVMGIINATPDSFSDGGQWLDPKRAIKHGLELVQQGAHILDVGGESTRPGSQPVAIAEELRRVIPVIIGIKQETDVIISIDTRHAEVARAALDAGTQIVNDISAGADPDMLPLVAARGAGIVLMHMQGEPSTMQENPRYAEDSVGEIIDFLNQAKNRALRAGVAPINIAVDPGIGFGKRLSDNLSILKNLPRFRVLDAALVLGLSRKSFLPALLARAIAPQERETPTQVVHALIADQCDILRVHDVQGTVDTLRLRRALGSSATCEP